jgi:hypothetical protein
MALQIRRGPTADRLSYTPVVGELVWDTQLNSLYIGNGSSAGGLPAGTLVPEDVQDIASTMLTSGSHQNITFTYDDALGRINSTFNLSSFDGTIEAAGFKGSVYASDSTLLINALTGAVNLNGTVKGNIVPDANEAYDLGSATYRFRDLYLSGSSIELGSATITATGSTVNLPLGSTMGGVPLAGGAGSDYNGNIIGDDSTIIVNAATKVVTASGGLIGPIFTNLIDSSDSSTITVTPATVFDSNVTVGGDVVFNNLLSVISNVPGETAVSLRTGTDDSNSLIMSFAKSRGTTASPTSVLADDQLGVIGWSGYSSGSFLTSSAIVGSATGTITSTKVPGKLEIFTVGDTNGLLVRNALFSTADGNEFSAPTTFTTDTYSASSAVVFGQHHDTVDGRNTSFIRSRGTVAAPTTVVSGDDIAEITFQGHDGTAYRAGMVWSIVADGAPASSTVPMSWVISTNNGSGFQTRITIFSNGDLSSTRAIRTSGTGGIGYTTGAGGTGSQVSAKTDTVTINKPTGEITTFADALGANTNVTFTLSNTAIVAGDHVIVSHVSGGTLGAYNICAIAAANSATITIRNITSGSLTEAPVIKFTLIKSVTA